jgi:quercetin dioxygenase-like cupin family protein
MASGQRLTLESGDALFIPNGESHALISDDQAQVIDVVQLASEPVCATVCCVKHDGVQKETEETENTVIFSGCMDFELGGCSRWSKRCRK